MKFSIANYAFAKSRLITCSLLEQKSEAWRGGCSVIFCLPKTIKTNPD